MIAEHVEDVVDHHTVVGSLDTVFCETHVQQSVEVLIVVGFVGAHIKQPSVRADGIILLVGEHFLAEACHAHLVCHFAAGSRHETLHLVGSFRRLWVLLFQAVYHFG